MGKEMKIGITERGDAGLDLSWIQRLGSVDGAVLITKNITMPFMEAVLHCMQERPLIIHATCTGWGHTRMEPQVPTPEAQIAALQDLINRGFPKEYCVLRIDPIIPTEEGLRRAEDVLRLVKGTVLDHIRVRVSALDEYRYVKRSLREAGFTPAYGSTAFGPSADQIAAMKDLFSRFPSLRFETCAEPGLICGNTVQQGCIDLQDLQLMGLADTLSQPRNPQGRSGCRCLSCKTELLTNKAVCPHQCLYCYWGCPKA